jgi:tRNA/tmRNA/rRNA uracil-C5-methylase (TrmA/RlmC/RlmD family)
VVGIELDPEAAAAAREGAPPGFQMLEGKTETLVRRSLPADLVVLNPPRTGVHEDVARAIVEAAVPRVVYVCCDPATLARDIKRLVGYRLTSLASFDLFPQTSHVETLAVLERTA